MASAIVELGEFFPLHDLISFCLVSFDVGFLLRWFFGDFVCFGK
ncbi:unnamed protein product [Arabidopsis halleri]